MMSERRFREGGESQTRIACNLCGSNGASVRCDKCQSMAFCLSCDDMYHRHPKRRYHLRKAVALEMPSKYFDGIPQTSQMRSTQNEALNSAHPSKMPVPPPRRKKKGITLSSIKETFTNTGNKLRRFVSNEKLSVPPVNGNRYLNELRPKDNPLIDKPMQTIRTQTIQNQSRVLPQNSTFGTLPTVRRNNSFPAKLPEPEPTPPPLPPPRPVPQESIYQNYRKASLPTRPQTQNPNVRAISKVSSSIGDLSKESSPALPQRKISVNTYDRRNCSLHDLRTNTSIDDLSNSQQMCPHFHPNQYYYGLPIHPWTTGSLNNSVEDMNLNVDDYDSDFSGRLDPNGNKKASIKRCKSAFQMYQSMGQCPPLSPIPPYFYPYPYYGHPCSGHSTPLPPCASPHLNNKSFNMSSRGSVDNMSTTSSSRGRTTKPKLNQKPKTYPLESREQLSDSGGRSVTSSSRQQSDFDDEEDFFSVSDNDSSEESLPNGQWSCRFCTFLNDKKNTICEICSKTNKKTKKSSNRSGVRQNRKKIHTNDNKPKVSHQSNDSNKSDLDFDEKLINEQKEIERELIRRLDNEKRIEKENQKISRKEEFIKKKNLGLPVEDKLLDQIRKDQESNGLNDGKMDEKTEESIAKRFDKISIQKSIENKSTECQTIGSEPIALELKTSETMTQTKNEDFSNYQDEKCAKSVQCQIQDNSSIKLNDKQSSNENSNKPNNEQNIQNQNLSSNLSFQSNGAINQTNGTYNQFQQQIQQNSVPSMGQPFNNYNDRQTAYGPEPVINGFSNHYQSPYNSYPMNPMMSPNVMPMNQMMSGFPMVSPAVPPMFSANPLQNMYTSPYQQSLNGSQTGLDRFGYRSNSITSDVPFGNPSQSQIGSRYSSCENLLSFNQLNDKNQQKSNQIESGVQLVQVLRDAEKNGFTSMDVEVALNYSPDKPIEWLEENWNKMCETVVTLSNNQIMQNESKSGNKRVNELDLLTEEEAKEGLRATKGNIFQAIDRCVKSKQNKASKQKIATNGTIDDKNKGSFSLKIQGVGNGFDNQDINDNIETQEVEEKEVLIKRNGSDEKVTLTAITVHTSEVQRSGTSADRKTMEKLLTDWKIEKLSSDRFRQQERERQKIRKFMELQKKMSEFDTDESEQEVEYQEVPNNNRRLEEIRRPTEQVVDNEHDHDQLPDQLHDEISDDNWKINSEFVDQNSGQNEFEREVSDFEEYLSNTESDLSDEFDKIDARIQAKLKENFNLANNEELTSITSLDSEVIDSLVEKFGENSSNGNQRINDLKQVLIESKSQQKIEPKVKPNPDSNVEPSVRSKVVTNRQTMAEPKSGPKSAEKFEQMSDQMSDPKTELNIESKLSSTFNENQSSEKIDFNSKQEMTESEAKDIMKEIDRNVRRSLEELELMELNVIKCSINEKVPIKAIYDESFGWARTEYECELCCEVFSIEELVSLIACTHYACKECLQKYFCVQVRERQRLIICCPFCEKPDMDPDDDDKVFEYLGLFDQLLKHLVPSDVYELFQRKLRDRALMREPGFMWCTQCNSGFIAPNPQAKTIMCPDCKNLTCTKCKKKWRKQHMDITCEQFEEWEKLNDPSFAEQQLDKHLKEFGIECPNCKFRYQLAKGGCMHFRCIQCSYDFCGGCARPFKMGNRCGVSPYCEKLGLHSHHPRNCLFYLRDKETQKLQSLLDKHKIQYKTKLDSDQKNSRCPVMEQKHTSYGLKDEPCNRFTENAGLCRLHYKEYLGDIIWKNGIDPIHIFNIEELELVLKRENVKLPPKEVYNSSNQTVRDQYQKELVELILDKVPLNLCH